MGGGSKVKGKNFAFVWTVLHAAEHEDYIGSRHYKEHSP